MAKGAVSKNNIADIILKTFPGSFISGKDLRIPVLEDGNEIQIKLNFTCAKDIIPHNGGTCLTSGATGAINYQEPTDEEKEQIAQLLVELGISIEE